MNTRNTALWCISLLAWWSAGLINATPVYIQDDPNAGLVAVGGETILRIRTASAGLSIQQRADKLQERLVTILAAPDLRPSDIIVVPSGKDCKILVNGKLFVTATQTDASFNKTTTRQLANTWADHIRIVLPKVNAKPNPNSGAPPPAK
jgi:hypothetical protein